MGRTACTEPQCLYKGALYVTFTFLSDMSNVMDIFRGLDGGRDSDALFLEVYPFL